MAQPFVIALPRVAVIVLVFASISLRKTRFHVAMVGFLKQIRWKKMVVMLPFLAGFAACDLCGDSIRPDGTNACLDFNLVSYYGMPYGPVTVKWKRVQLINTYNIAIYTKAGLAGYAPHVSWKQDSTVITMDPVIVKQTLNTDGRFTITGYANFLSGIGYCQFDYPIYIPKSAPATATLPPPAMAQPPVGPHVPPAPPPPPSAPTATRVPFVLVTRPPLKLMPTATRPIPG